MTAGFPDAAARLMAARRRLGARALEIALERDPTLGARYDDLALRRLLRDTEAIVERIARSIASRDPHVTAAWADQVAPVYRRRLVPMDDLINLFESIRQSTLTVLSYEERGPADAAIDAAILVLRRYRRLAGDARKRNPILAALYKGA